VGTVLAYVVLAAAVSALAVWEIRTSWVQSRLLSRFARGMAFTVAPGPSPTTEFPTTGPYDERLGYVRLPEFVDTLESQGYTVETQARMSEKMIQAVESGLFPLYREKSRTGLSIISEDGEVISAFRYPERFYASYDSIPDLVLRSLFFIENREALDPDHPYKNPAVEWDRLVKGIFDLARAPIDDSRPAGGSTLATQIEKYRHSPNGRTGSIGDKIRQVATASCRSYLDGVETTEVRRRIILDYINTVPLAAIAGYGEVNGLPDGLWAWYGADFDRTNRLLKSDSAPVSGKRLAECALAYRQVLSLFLAHRRPAHYLLDDPDDLTALADSYLRLLAVSGVISEELRDAALTAQPRLLRKAPERKRSQTSRHKAVEGVRIHLLKLLGVERLYDLDRLDLAVESTLDKRTLESVSNALRRLRDPAYLQSSGLVGEHLLDRPNAEGVVCSFTLYEHAGDANVLRVQTDNFDQPLNVNEGTKLELGSTAKLRALVTYLEIISELHERFAGVSRDALEDAPIPKSDALSRWAMDYLSEARDKSLRAMLDAAMERRYSANPRQSFFTGGGLHEFSNFDEEDDRRVFSVRTAFHRSINLSFIRLMRDIVYYHMFRVSGSTAQILEDSEDPNREVFLTRFADYEGRKFIVRFYRKYQHKTPKEIFEELSQKVSNTPSRLSMLYRSQNPDSSFESFERFLRSRIAEERLKHKDIRRYYDKYTTAEYNLADQGYLTRIHPLELWTARYMRDHPDALLGELFEASEGERQEVYRWLFKTRSKNAQDARIKTILEIEAFEEIHEGWRRLGYPFETLVPSYATAIGSSADRPAALAELVGVILNDGVRYPSVRTTRLRFAEGTPYETILRPAVAAPERVMSSEIASILRQELIGVVESGTAVRVRGAFVRRDGTAIPVGGKTGTGDNQYEVYGVGPSSSPVWIQNRTATFVFMIGDRFYGTVTVYVSGPESTRFGFTSSLPVQILKGLSPSLMPLVERNGRAASLDRSAPSESHAGVYRAARS
jgi:membrane peptidoglycan carboxypeptidase